MCIWDSWDKEEHQCKTSVSYISSPSTISHPGKTRDVKHSLCMLCTIYICICMVVGFCHYICPHIWVIHSIIWGHFYFGFWWFHLHGCCMWFVNADLSSFLRLNPCVWTQRACLTCLLCQKYIYLAYNFTHSVTLIAEIFKSFAPSVFYLM